MWYIEIQIKMVSDSISEYSFCKKIPGGMLPDWLVLHNALPVNYYYHVECIGGSF